MQHSADLTNARHLQCSVVPCSELGAGGTHAPLLDLRCHQPIRTRPDGRYLLAAGSLAGRTVEIRIGGATLMFFAPHPQTRERSRHWPDRATPEMERVVDPFILDL